MGFLFGSEPKTKIQSVSLFDPEQQKIYTSLANLLQGQVGAGVSPYPGTYTPGATTNQQQIYELVNQLLRGQGPMQSEATGVLTDAMNLMDPTKAQDYWEKGIKAPMMQSWQQDIVPQILEQFAAYDAGGSGPARKAVAESGRYLETDMGSMLENYLTQLRREAEGAAQTGLKYPQTLLQSVLGPATQQRQIESEQLQEPYEKWMMSQPWANPWLKYVLPLLNLKTKENIATQSGGQQGIFGDLLKAGASLGSAWIKGPSKAPIVLA